MAWEATNKTRIKMLFSVMMLLMKELLTVFWHLQTNNPKDNGICCADVLTICPVKTLETLWEKYTALFVCIILDIASSATCGGRFSIITVIKHTEKNMAKCKWKAKHCIRPCTFIQQPWKRYLTRQLTCTSGEDQSSASRGDMQEHEGA